MNSENNQFDSASALYADARILAKRYGVSLRQIQKMADRGELPFVKIGRRCKRFHLAACDQYFADRLEGIHHV